MNTELELMTTLEVAKVLRYEGKNAIRNARRWLKRHNVEPFRHGGFYEKDKVWGAFERQSEKCSALGNEGSSIMSAGRSVLVAKSAKLKNTALDLLNLRKQEIMQAL